MAARLCKSRWLFVCPSAGLDCVLFQCTRSDARRFSNFYELNKKKNDPMTSTISTGKEEKTGKKIKLPRHV